MDCPSCSKPLPGDSFFCHWCRTYAPAPRKGTKAGLFRRWVGWMLDIPLFVAVTMAAIALAATVSQDLAMLVAVLFPLGYLTWCTYLFRRGTSPGKKLLGLHVVQQESGAIPGFGAMVIRETIGRYVLSLLIFGLGLLWALFDKDAQTWHDKLAHTVVLRH